MVHSLQARGLLLAESTPQESGVITPTCPHRGAQRLYSLDDVAVSTLSAVTFLGSEATKVFFALCWLQADKIDSRSNTIPFTVKGYWTFYVQSGGVTFKSDLSRRGVHQARAWFVVERNHSNATTTATHITCTNTNACIHSQSYPCARREWAWAAMSHTGSRDVLPVGPGAAPNLQARTERRGLPSRNWHDLPHNATPQYSTYHRPRSTLVQATGKKTQHDWVRAALLSMGTWVTTDVSLTHARDPSLRFGSLALPLFMFLVLARSLVNLTCRRACIAPWKVAAMTSSLRLGTSASHAWASGEAEEQCVRWKHRRL